MRTFALQLLDATHAERIDNVVSFVGEDVSGSFGIQAGHERMMSNLLFGLARYRTAKGGWHYVAVPGAVLYFVDNVLTLSSRRYLLDDDYARIVERLEQQLLREEVELQTIKESLHRMEEEVLKRMWRLGHGEVAG